MKLKWKNKLSAFLCMVLALALAVPSVPAGAVGSAGGTGSGGSGERDSSIAAAAGKNARVRGFGMKVYVCDVNEIAASLTSASIALKEPQQTATMGFGCNPRYYIEGATDALFWTGSGYSGVSYDNAFVRGIPSMPGTVVHTSGSGQNALYDGSSASPAYDAAFGEKYTIEAFKPIADYFGYKGNIENAVIVFEPFVVIQSEYKNNGYFAYTYQSARCGMDAHNYNQSARGAGDNVFSILAPQGSNGVGIANLCKSGIWSGGGSGISAATASLGSICCIAASGHVSNGRPLTANAGYFAYGPGIGSPAEELAPVEKELEEADADLLLYDWELNHIFPSMFDEKEGLGKGYLKVNSQYTRNKTTEILGVCERGTSYSSGGVQHPKDYNVVYYENSASGRIISADDELSDTKLFLTLPSPAIPTRETMKEGYNYNTENLTGAEYIDYGVNLVRWLFKDDGRVYSSLVLPSIPESYLEDVLGLTKGDVVEYSDVTLVADKRNSMCLIDDKLEDRFSWMGKFKLTNMVYAYDSIEKTLGCAGGHTRENEEGEEEDAGSCGASVPYYPMRPGYPKAIKPFNAGGAETINTYNFELTSQAYKYLTDTILTGRPDKTEDRLAYQPTSDNGNNISDSVGQKFKMTLMQTTGTVLKYFPEVPMLATHLEGTAYEETEPERVITIGEVQRSSASGMMLVYKIVGDGVSGNSYSDTSVGGSASLGLGNTGFTAGGDFTVKANTGFGIKLSGYALDITESGDATFQERTQGVNVKDDWGSAGKEALLNNYMNWAYQFLNVNNYQADFTMQIGSKTYNNFSATIGSFTANASQSTETGSYALTFKHGQLVEDGGFNEFISALASDYEVDSGTAKTIWEDSTIKQAVLKAIESDASEANKSKPQDGERGGAGLLGNSSHWYDEEVRTMVIRRYETPEATIRDIIAMDKLDLGNAADEVGGTSFSGRFGLTVYFARSTMTGLNGDGGGFVVYSPSANGGNAAASISEGGVVCHNVHVSGADFTVTTSTTATGKRR
ncbi:MAG: hypothetical protein NC548_25250 [Lachnospiraceae bacterium]|nr:hypothetical protein [Lachnospiraceae bacterium]